MLRKSKTAGSVAKERLKVILVHDKANVSLHILEKMKDEICNALSKHVDIDLSESEIRMTKTCSDDNKTPVPALVANIVIKANRV